MGSQVIDPYKTQEGYVEGNDYALPYYSSYMTENGVGVDPNLLKHVNCGYLSTPGRPPTLEALKQHAQSLAVLISQIAPSQASGEINNSVLGKNAKPFQVRQAFDWLNDLTSPYKSDEPDHHRPLNNLVNLVKSNSDTKGVEFHCALNHGDADRFQDADSAYLEEVDRKPFARHSNLLYHANECLEILDHELSATGGLMSALPANSELESKQFEDAKGTLIGQWLGFTQRIVSRIHDLELDYAQALDLLGGDSVVPMQQLSVHGPDGRSGREMVLPQDRWVLANAGNDVLEFLHQSLDKKEAMTASQAERLQTVTGEALKGPNDTERGIVALDLSTRYYRLRGNSRGPLFVLPAYADRPGTVHTRELHSRPTVVTMPTAKFPERMSEWEKKVRSARDRAEQQTFKTADDEKALRHAYARIQMLEGELRVARAKVSSFEKAMDQDKAGSTKQ